MSLIREILEQVCRREKAMSEKFYVLWVDIDGRAGYRIAEKSKAFVDAARLAEQTSGRVYILQTIGYYAPNKAPVDYFDLP